MIRMSIKLHGYLRGACTELVYISRTVCTQTLLAPQAELETDYHRQYCRIQTMLGA